VVAFAAEGSSYLRGLPQLPDWLLDRLDGRRQIRSTDRALAEHRIWDLARQIREARKRYEDETGEQVEIEGPPVVEPES
jgi:hypothetical protein